MSIPTMKKAFLALCLSVLPAVALAQASLAPAPPIRAPVNDNQAANKAYVDTAIATSAPYISLSAAGCLPNGPTCGGSITAVVNAALAAGKNIYIPPGHWRTSVPITLDYTSSTAFFGNSVPRLNVFGAGSSVSVLQYTGAGSALVLKGGPNGGGHEAHNALSGFTISGTGVANSVGLDLDHVAWIALTDVHVTGFDKAISGVDVEYLRAVQNVIRFNIRGVTITSRANTGGTADANSSDPNAHSWIASTIGNNSEYGLLYTRPSSLSFVGTDIQYNGQGAPDTSNPAGARPGFGLKIVNPGTQGGVALTMQGGYVENNGGVADVWVRHDNPVFINTQNVFEIAGTGFMRTYNTPRSANFVALDFAAGTGPFAGRIAAAFKNVGTATSTGPAVAFIGTQQRKDVQLDMSGSVFTAGEKVDEFTAYTPALTRPSGSGFTATATAKFARRWQTTTVRGTATINTYGTGGTGSVNITLPYAVTSDQFFTVVDVYDSTSSVLIPAVVIPGNNFFTIPNLPASDGRVIQFSVTYPID